MRILFLLPLFLLGCQDYDFANYIHTSAKRAGGEEVCYYSEPARKKELTGYYCVREVSYQYIRSKRKTFIRAGE